MKVLHFALLIVYVNGMDEYQKERKLLLESESRRQIGADIVLSPMEKKVSNFLVKTKKKELEDHSKYGIFLQEIDIFVARDEIEQSEVYKIIKQMPKGAIHHIHDMGMTDIMPIIKKWSYHDKLYVCYHSDMEIHMYKFFENPPSNDTKCLWQPLNDARKEFGNDESFDQLLLSNFSLTKDDVKNSNQNQIWKRFQNCFISMEGFISFEPVWVDYFHLAVQNLVQDNVQFVEVRSVLPYLYDLHKTYYDPEHTLIAYVEADKKNREKYNEHYIGTKIVYAPLRFLPKEKIKGALLKAIEMQEKYGEYFGGFDLVGQEDTGFPFQYYIEELLLPHKLGKTLPYILHAGETDWQGRVDENLFDAVLLNATRIGHGYAINKHPHLKEVARKKDIAIELCPISNQVLGLVKDLRDHPAAVLLAENYPVSVSPDDPGLMNGDGVSFDLYHVYMGMVPQNAGLKVLKQLAINSIKYSSLNERGKKRLENMWKKKWKEFIEKMVEKYGL